MTYDIEVYRDSNGNLHRENRPAAIRPDGTQEWWHHGERHREGRPAIIYPDGSQEWFLHGKHHRENGPAIIWPDGTQEWFLHGKKLDDIQVFVIESKVINEG